MFEFYFPEWFFVALSLIILVIALRAILWKRVLRVLDARREMIEKAQLDAREVEAEKHGLEERREAVSAELEQMTVDKMKEARVLAGKEYDRIVEDAEEKARLIIAQAQAQAQREREGMLHSAREEIMAAALAATGALLNANMNSERNEQLIKTMLSKRSAAG